MRDPLAAYQFLLWHIRQGELVELRHNNRLQGVACALAMQAMGYDVLAFEAQMEITSLWKKTQKIQLAALQLNPAKHTKGLIATNGGVGEADMIRRALASRYAKPAFEINRATRLGPWQDLLEMKFLNGTTQVLPAHAVPGWVDKATVLLSSHELRQGLPMSPAATAAPRPRL